jgi:cell division protein FtsW
MKALFNYIKGDKVIWVIVLLLSIVSVLVVYSSVEALAFRSHSGNAGYYLIKHVIIIMFGFLLIYLTHNLKYTFFSRISQIALYLSVPLLLFTLLKGVNEGNANRWLQIPGTGLTFQPSDFAKLALLIYVARMLAIKQTILNDFKHGFLPIIIPVIAICGLIFPSNFSTAFLLFVNCLFIMFIGKAKITHLLLTVGIAVACAGLFILLVFAFPHINNRVATWKSRIENFSKGDKADNYQADLAMIAIANGGPVGKGPGNSTQKAFLPQASSDFIFAILVEEYGMIMALGIIFLYLTFLFRGVRIATRSGKTFGSLMAAGLSINLVLQALVNMCVAVHLIPVTGQPLPLVSMGGTSIWFTSIAVGIILSVSKETESNVTENLATTT